jgi:hypothetical protein
MYKYLILNHIPRCGGSSFRKSIYEGIKSNSYFQQSPAYISQYTHANICLYEQPHLFDAIHPNTLLFIDHSPTFCIEDYFNINLSEAYRVLTLRHPVSRIISHIHFFYGRHIDSLSPVILKNYLNRYGHLTIDYLTTYKYKDKSLNEKFSLAKSIIKDYQFYFKIEDQKLCEIFNDTNPFELHIPNYHLNASPVDSLLEITHSVKNIIHNQAKLEIQLLEDYYEMDI